MSIYRFRHPGKNINYTWNLDEGLLYFNEAQPVALDRSTQKGELLFRFLEYGKLTNEALLEGSEDYQREITVRSYIQPMLKTLRAEEGKTLLVRTIHGYGYEWLPKVKKQDVKQSEGEDDENDQEITHDSLLNKMFFLDKPYPPESPLLGNIFNNTALMQEKTEDFVGRDFIFDRLDAFMSKYDRGYFVIEGDPGIGKSALMAWLALERRCISHFNIRCEGITRVDQFLVNLCSQLILKYDLGYRDLPPETTRDSGFLKDLLSKVSKRIAGNEKALILIDALDEAESLGQSVNTLFLPMNLPKGIYAVLSTRTTDQVILRFDSPHQLCEIEHNGADNLKDIGIFIENQTARPELRAYLRDQNVEQPLFTKTMTEKSEGNFMYLHHVLPEIGKGIYHHRPLEFLPMGLTKYYEDHWWSMRGADEAVWFAIKLPVVMALTIVREPVSIDLLSKLSGVTDHPRIRQVLREWRQFIHLKLVLHEKENHDTKASEQWQKRYRVYHTCYEEFICQKDEIKDQGGLKGKPEVDLKKAHHHIAKVLIDDLIQRGILGPDFNQDLK